MDGGLNRLLEHARLFYFWLCNIPHNRAKGQPIAPRCLTIVKAYYWQPDIHWQNCGGTQPPENRCCCSCCSGGCCCGSRRARCLHCCSTSRHADPMTPAQITALIQRNIPCLFQPRAQQPANFRHATRGVLILFNGEQLVIPRKANPYPQLL